MDAYLRSASHSLVTAALLFIWGGVLLGLAWRVITLIWNVAQNLWPRQRSSQVKLIDPDQPRLTGSPIPALVANSPDGWRSETCGPLLLPPDSQMAGAEEILVFIPLEIEI